MLWGGLMLYTVVCSLGILDTVGRFDTLVGAESISVMEIRKLEF